MVRSFLSSHPFNCEWSFHSFQSVALFRPSLTPPHLALVLVVGVSPPLNPFLRTFSINGSIIIIILIVIFPHPVLYTSVDIHLHPHSQSLLNFQLFVFVRPNKCSTIYYYHVQLTRLRMVCRLLTEHPLALTSYLDLSDRPRTTELKLQQVSSRSNDRQEQQRKDKGKHQPEGGSWG